jgi:hypothetical protein
MASRILRNVKKSKLIPGPHSTKYPKILIFGPIYIKIWDKITKIYTFTFFLFQTLNICSQSIKKAFDHKNPYTNFFDGKFFSTILTSKILILEYVQIREIFWFFQTPSSFVTQNRTNSYILKKKTEKIYKCIWMYLYENGIVKRFKNSWIFKLT